VESPVARHILVTIAFAGSLLWPALVSLQAPPDLSGNWIRGGGAVVFSPWAFTTDGERRYRTYDFMKDDPGYGCVASSWTRAWMNPNVVVRITQTADHVRLQHEFMDIDRLVPLIDPGSANPQRSTPIKGMPSLGRSSAWYDGDTLVIETVDIAGGWLATMEQWAGLPQSRRMHTMERLRRSGNALTIEVTHFDPSYYRRPFVTTIPYQGTNWELMHYGCTPEEAAVVAPRNR
jgi:hypothetical protein